MATMYETGGAQSGATFDVASWFAEWSDHGGIAVAGASQLYLARLEGIDRQACARLDQLRDQIHHHRGGAALARLLNERAMAEGR